mgnify:CR=1 FL=1
MEERKHEIQVHRDVQRAANKAAEEERHKVALESKERMTKVKAMKLKHCSRLTTIKRPKRAIIIFLIVKD